MGSQTPKSTAFGSALTDILSKVSEGEPHSQINVGLTNGNRISLTNWELAEGFLIERWQNGRPRYVVPLAQIVIIEVPEKE